MTRRWFTPRPAAAMPLVLVMLLLEVAVERGSHALKLNTTHSYTTRGVAPVPRGPEHRTSRGRLKRRFDPSFVAVAPESRATLDSVAPTQRAFLDWEAWAAFSTAVGHPQQHNRTVPIVDDASLPYFLVLGVQKGGTTFLRGLLQHHRYLHGGKGLSDKCVGEPHFFDYQAKDLLKAAEVKHGETLPPSQASLVMMTGYSKHHWQYPVCQPGKRSDALTNEFPTADRPLFYFDVTPRYFALRAQGVQRLRMTVPHAYFVVLLRDPVARYGSEMAMEMLRQRAKQLVGKLRRRLVEARTGVGRTTGRNRTSTGRTNARVFSGSSRNTTTPTNSDHARAAVGSVLWEVRLVRHADSPFGRRLLARLVPPGVSLPEFHPPQQMDRYLRTARMLIAKSKHDHVLAPLYRGLFEYEIGVWTQFLPLERFKFLCSKRLFTNASDVVNDLLEWLHLPAMDVSPHVQHSFKRPRRVDLADAFTEDDADELRAFFREQNQHIEALSGISLADLNLLPAPNKPQTSPSPRQGGGTSSLGGTQKNKKQKKQPKQQKRKKKARAAGVEAANSSTRP